MGRSSVFSLEQIYRKQVVGTWSKIPEVFRYIQTNNFGNDYGYSLGGYYPNSGPGNGSTYVQRIDFTNDTATGSSRGNLSSQRSAHGAASSLTAMYTANGQNYGVSPSTTIVDRLDYASDTLTATRKGDVPSARYATAGVSNTDYGFWIGGTPGPANAFRTDWANDSSAAVPSASWYPGIPGPYFGAAAGNLSYGYAFAGSGGGSNTGRIDYSNHTATMLEKGKGTYSGYGIAGTGNANYGYYAGGPGPKSNVSRLDYANDDTAATPKGPLDTGKLCAGATATPSYGYWIGGADGGWGNPGTTSSQRLDFSNDTATTSPKGPLAAGVSYNSGTSTRAFGFPTPSIGNATRTETALIPVSNHGYYFGSYSPSPTSRTERLDMDNDTALTVLKGSLNKARFSSCSAAGNSTAGHFIGGYDGGSPGRTSSHDRMDYSNDTATCENKATLPHDTYGAASTGNTSYGYWWGGRNDAYSPNYLSYVHRVDYSNSTITAMPPSATQGNQRAACGNQNYGWWMGAQQTETLPYLRNWVYRFDYANDTGAASLRGPLMYSLYAAAATGNANFGYLAGGSPNNSYVQRVEYANDTPTALHRASLEFTSNNPRGATGNSSFGYFNVRGSKMNRIDYSNDTATLVSLNNLPDNGDHKAGASPLMNGFPTMAPGPKTVDKGADGYKTGGPVGPAFGYISGGPGETPHHSIIQRIDFSNDSSSPAPKGNLTAAGHKQAGVSSINYGYVCGGLAPSNSSIIARIDYANDDTTAALKGNLTTARRSATGVGNRDYGYVGGGFSPETSLIDRIDYSNDTATTSPKGPLASARYEMGAAGNLSYGWWAGGGPSPRESTVQRLDYSSDTTTAATKGPITNSLDYLRGAGNASYGYIAGGYAPDKSTVDRIDYSNDSATATTKGPLSTPAWGMGSVSSMSGYGYYAGGGPGGSGTVVHRIEFANDTATASARANMSTSTGKVNGVSAQNNAMSSPLTFLPRIRWVDSATEAPASVAGPAFGYFGGGENPSPDYLSSVSRIDYSNDTATAASKGALNVDRRDIQATGNSSFGYFGGGHAPTSPVRSSYVSRVDYSNDTPTTAAKGDLSIGRVTGAATGNNSFGYFIAGEGAPGAVLSSVDRIDYSDDTSTSLIKGSVSVPNVEHTAVGNSNFGYMLGGHAHPNYYSKVDRIDYSNDTAAATPKGPLSAIRYLLAATGTADYGYVGGGRSPSTFLSTTDRVDYSNDTATASPKGTLNYDPIRLGATGSGSFGYWAGGTGLDYPAPSGVSRLDFSNDTATGSPKGTLTVNTYGLAGMSALANGLPQTTAAAVAAPVQPPFPYPEQLPTPGPAFGYITGGAYPGVSSEKSTIDRIDFGNDTATASPKGNTSVARKNHGAAGNRTHGYNFGGFSPSSLTDRIDYANDTATAAPKGLIVSEGPAGKGYVHTGGTESFGYIAGGYVPSSYGSPTNRSSTIDRLDYSNDSANTLSKGGLSDGRSSGSFTGNQSFGYQCGGKNPGSVSTVFRIDYGNDTATAATKGPLSATRRYNAATGNASFGYVATNGNNSDTSVDRIDYSNDTATASPKGPLSAASKYMGATSTSSFGYFAGGQDSSSNVHSRIDRIDYSNDTATTSPKGNLSIAKNKSAGVSARQSGLPN